MANLLCDTCQGIIGKDLLQTCCCQGDDTEQGGSYTYCTDCCPWHGTMDWEAIRKVIKERIK